MDLVRWSLCYRSLRVTGIFVVFGTEESRMCLLLDVSWLLYPEISVGNV